MIHIHILHDTLIPLTQIFPKFFLHSLLKLSFFYVKSVDFYCVDEFEVGDRIFTGDMAIDIKF